MRDTRLSNSTDIADGSVQMIGTRRVFHLLTKEQKQKNSSKMRVGICGEKKEKKAVIIGIFQTC